MRVIAVLAVLAGTLACLPSVALAQSAGDNQYVDPFQEEANQPSGEGEQGGGGETTTAPAEPAPTTEPSDTGAVETDTGAAATSAQALPATGPAPLPPALLGVALLLGGAALWRAMALRRSA